MEEQWYYQSAQYNQEAKGLLTKLGIKTQLSKIPILGDILFWMQFNWNGYA